MIYNTGGMRKNYDTKKQKQIVFVRHGESTQNFAEDFGKEYDINNIVLTKKGIHQAEITGKYLKKIYGKFDIIYSSPITRCVETSKIFMKHLNYSFNNLIQDPLLIEAGEFNHDFFESAIKEDKKSVKLEKAVYNELNPFKKLDLSKLFYKRFSEYYNVDPNDEGVYRNYTKFLDKIKRSSHKKILVIAHAGTLVDIQKIICGVSLENDIISFCVSNDSTNPKCDCGNCSIMCVKFVDNKHELITPPDNSHLNV